MKRKENRGTVLSYSLPRRLLVLFLIFALTLYAVGMAVTYQLKEKGPAGSAKRVSGPHCAAVRPVQRGD